MGSLVVVVVEVLGQHPSKMLLAERDDVGEQLASNAADEALDIGVEVGAVARELDGGDAGVAKDFAGIDGEDRVVVQDEMSLVSQEAIEVVADGARAETVGQGRRVRELV